MSEKKSKKTKLEDVTEIQAEAAEMPENSQQVQAEIEALKKQLEETEAKAKENLDGWQRSQAEFVNYKNRMQRDSEMMRAMMKGDILK